MRRSSVSHRYGRPSLRRRLGTNSASSYRALRAILVVFASTVPACASDPSTVSSDGGSQTGDAGRLSLVALRVTAPDDRASPSLGLIPAFSPAIHDYYVRCAAGSNALTVSLTASPGAEGRLVGPISSPPAPTQTQSLRVKENEAIVAEAADGAGAVQYWVRCLPHDFPMLNLTLHPKAGAATPGYYLLGNYFIQNQEGPYAMVLDSRAVPVWYYRSPVQTTGVSAVDSLAPGDVSFKPNQQGTPPPFEVRSLSPLATTQVAAPHLDLHELQRLSNGDYVVITEGVLTDIDLRGLEISLPDGGVMTFGAHGSIVTCGIAEVDPTSGAVVWSWAAEDHFDPVKDLTYFGPDILVQGTEIVQPYHCNSIDVDPNGNLLVSGRHMDSIFYIERPSGRVLWKMGGSTSNKDNAVYVRVADPFYRQHDARLQRAGRIPAAVDMGRCRCSTTRRTSQVPHGRSSMT